MKENTIQYLRLTDIITIFVGKFKIQRILMILAFRRILRHMGMIKNRFIFQLLSFNTVWGHMIFGLKQKSVNITMLL